MYPPPQQPATQQPKKRSVWGRWWMILIYVLAGLMVLSCIGALASGGGDEPDSASEDSGGDGSESQETEEESSYFAEEYPVFEPVEHSGEGDSVIDLPEGVSRAMVTAAHDGDAHFAITALDESNQGTGDLLVNTTGSYSGTTALGMYEIGGEAVRLEVSADGAWTITIAPIADAPALASSGEGDAVFLYEGDAATWAITHDGDAHFAVHAFTSEAFDMPLLVNETGAYDGSVAAGAGPAVVVVVADGSWTITPQ